MQFNCEKCGSHRIEEISPCSREIETIDEHSIIYKDENVYLNTNAQYKCLDCETPIPAKNPQELREFLMKNYKDVPTKVTIELNLGNDSFQSTNDVAKALKQLAKDFKHKKVDDGKKIQDDNGNTVGLVKLTY